MQRILIVEDDESTREMLSEALKAMGFDPVTADNGKTGLQAFHSESFSLILTDMKMPVMDGITMIKAIRKENPRIPIIVITAYPSVDSAVDSLALGADYYLVKPININDLEIKISKSLEKIRLQQKFASKKMLTRVLVFLIPLWVLLGFFLGRWMR
jgi:DNA-binding response OmpR family regulator